MDRWTVDSGLVGRGAGQQRTEKVDSRGERLEFPLVVSTKALVERSRH